MFGLFKKKKIGATAIEAYAAKRRSNYDLDFLGTSYKFVAVDVETANENSHSICQIGLALVDHDNTIRTYSCFVNPRENFARFNIDLHGINHRKVAGAPAFPEIFGTLSDFLNRHILIQHSTFDRGAFNGACDLAAIEKIKSQWIDSVQIARRAWPEFKGNGGHGLANLKNELRLDFDHHDAGEDARAAAQVVLLAEERLGVAFDSILTRNPTKRSYPKRVSIPGNEAGPLHGKTVCFTGKLGMSRDEAAQIAAQSGLTVRTGVSKKLNILVVGDQDLEVLNGHDKSSKHRKAEELIADGQPIQILGETEFHALVSG
ncbi:exonuclease domain-containing protein [Paracoccus sp. Z330]|uniref:Exonuclease domain-containing protein n=1 Tax=Paracoccus onchidii TaxID=3017813 RepID=A0ABT4ZF20_9RHOB|nr:exonuclease domain-containing protein [Paracoccus onchidii]MDB6177920.1 exonuclease domain-containing protein [Paracoccus onchidii]